MKAVLVLDEMPKNCNDCMAFSDDPDKHDYCWCRKEDRKISWQWVDNTSSATYCPRPDWCPLQEPVIYKDIEKYEKDEYKGGWNDAMYQIGAVTMEEAYPWMKEE